MTFIFHDDNDPKHKCTDEKLAQSLQHQHVTLACIESGLESNRFYGFIQGSLQIY